MTLLVLAAVAGGAHARFNDASDQPRSALASAVGTHEVSGTAREDAVVSGTFARVDLRVDRLDGAPIAGGLRRTVPAREPIERGDLVTATVEVEPLTAFDDADIADRLRPIGLDATAAFPERWTVQDGDRTSLAALLARLRRAMVRHIERALPEPASGLASGMLVGERRALPPSIVEDLRRTGTTHLVVVSGQNIALLAGILVAALTLAVSRRTASWIALLTLFPYVVFIGADPPVVRAAFMAVGITAGGILGRRTPGWLYLLYAVALVLAWNPRYATDLAFQLSASATLGVVVIAPALRDAILARLRLASTGFGAPAIELAATATGAALAVVPVQVAAFERVSLWTIPANILGRAVLRGDGGGRRCGLRRRLQRDRRRGLPPRRPARTRRLPIRHASRRGMAQRRGGAARAAARRLRLGRAARWWHVVPRLGSEDRPRRSIRVEGVTGPRSSRVSSPPGSGSSCSRRFD